MIGIDNIHVARAVLLSTCLCVFCDEHTYRKCKNGLANQAAEFDCYLRDLDLACRCGAEQIFV